MRAFLFFLLACTASAHAPGAEYTYLSMFLKPPSGGEWTDEATEYLRDTYVNRGMFNRRRLQEEDETGTQREEPQTIRKVVRVASGELERELESVAEDGAKQGEDLQRVGRMLAKLLKQYEVKSMVDVPCRAHLHWMPIFLKYVGKNRDDKLKYYCVDTNRRILEAAKERMMSVHPKIETKFMKIRFWKEALPRADVVFSWGGLDNMRPENVVSFVGRLAKSKGLVFIANHGGGKGINLRKEPFTLKKPMRIVGELSVGSGDKQLYIYRAPEMAE